MELFFFIVVIWFVLAIVNSFFQEKAEEKRQRLRDYYAVQERSGRAMSSTSIATVTRAIDEYKVAYQEAEPILDSHDLNFYKSDIGELQEHLELLGQDKWERQAEKRLSEFMDLYMLIIDPNFSDVDIARKSKNKCMRLYDSYWEWTEKISNELAGKGVNPKKLWENARTVFRGAFEESAPQSDHAMLVWGQTSQRSTRQMIEKRLDAAVQAMQPEYRRKMRLYGMIKECIREKESIQRSAVLKWPFDGYTKEEIRVCYRELLNMHSIVECKMGERYFVMLSDKESEKEQ